jgi:hypothetical protein
MKLNIQIPLACCFILLTSVTFSQRIFDVHIHGGKDPVGQLNTLKKAGVYAAAVSTSWQLQQQYKGDSGLRMLCGLMFPCPNGIVPYSQQKCYADGKQFPEIKWVEEQIRAQKIDFFGEVLSQYYGISASDSLLFPYYALAEKYNLPVGIHTGLAGPDHGSPDFKVSMGNPLLMEGMLRKFPKLRVWIMHAGAPFLQETIAIMSVYRNVYADISAISNPYIMPARQFSGTIKSLIDAGFEDRLMFGSDNGNIQMVIKQVNELDFLTKQQKDKIFYKNAELFFGSGQ